MPELNGAREESDNEDIVPRHEYAHENGEGPNDRNLGEIIGEKRNRRGKRRGKHRFASDAKGGLLLLFVQGLVRARFRFRFRVRVRFEVVFRVSGIG